ncbi:MAG TPA: TRAP transporter small permease subunit [Deltaproteobacteria bacterium]|nr:TRAP transporter small permease subunit [Deltaproteobacteria bacterium]MBW2049842.1 TRAP transporter small permease subunit [Deltaproteobacteria bacterium]MBW2354631.1 TRAP transporter small permease subunit [Deltaproteobacteria bacterium]HDH97672.1 TRAP transporter small permease subunit [Deltaproteobacteria bacterium]
MQIKTLLKFLDGFSEWSGRTFVWLIIPLAILVVYEVISRRFFNAPNIWSTEVIDFIYGPHFMLIAAYTLLYKGHVKIDVIYDKFSPRTRGILDIITYMVFFFPFCIIVLHQGIIFAHTSWSIGETSDSAALKIVPLIKTMIPVSIGLLLIQGIATYIRAIVQAIKGEEI